MLISVSPSKLEFVSLTGDPNHESQILSIWNAGSDVLEWQITKDCNWLQVMPSSGASNGEVDQVTVSVDYNEMGPGFYTCELVISDSNAINSPQTVQATLSIYSDGEIYVPADCSTIQEAIDAALDGAVIIVEPSIYTGQGNRDIDFNGKAITIRSIDPNDPNVIAATIIDCNGGEMNNHLGFQLRNGEDANSILSGFTITNAGHAIYCDSSSPTISNCIIAENTDTGIYCLGGGPTITNCSIDASGAQGICCYWSMPTISNCTIAANGAEGICCYWGGQIITNCTIAANGAEGIYFYGSWEPAITNCTIVGNGAEGIYFSGSWEPAITNCTVVENATGGIYSETGQPTILTNCIIRDNWGSEIEGPTVVTYSNIKGGWPGKGIIDDDPCFIRTGYWEYGLPNWVFFEGDYHLQSSAGRWDPNSNGWIVDANTSLCIDAGNPGYPLGDEPDDANNVRINMGAFGGTAKASKTPTNWSLLADLSNDGKVDFVDLGHWADDWLIGGGKSPGDLDRDGMVNIPDYSLLAEDWLLETTWCLP